jgi:hypothetical protein
LLQLKETDIDYKRKDKFLIQSIKLPPTFSKLDAETSSTRIVELWSQAEQISKTVGDGDIVQKKLKCVLIPPEGAADSSIKLPTEIARGLEATLNSSSSKQKFDVSETVEDGIV